VWKWTHHERSQRVFTELTRPHGASVGIARFGGSVGETTDEHLRVWLNLPDQWRFESDDHVNLRNGATRWIGGSTHITELAHDETTLEDTEIGMLMMPGSQLMGALRFGEPTNDLIAGRPCLKVSATLDRGHGARRFNPVDVRLGCIDHTYWFDEVTGIALRLDGLIDDEPCTIIGFKEVEGQPSPHRPRLPVHRTPRCDRRTTGRLLVRMAEIRGVDLTGVDREDLQAVQAAMHGMRRSNQPAPEIRLTLQKAKHVPVGDPPADGASARESIDYAFTHHDEVDESGEDLVNVQRGRGLAGPHREAQRRVPAGPDSTAKIVLDDVKPVRPARNPRDVGNRSGCVVICPLFAFASTSPGGL
jgi:hypothetical protein